MIRPEEGGWSLYMARFLDQFSPKLKPNFYSNSVATVRQAALIGEIIALLPRRMAEGDLVEVFPERTLSHTGKHQLFLASEHYCDRGEVDFLADKLKAVCNLPGNC